MRQRVLQIHPADDLLVALEDLPQGLAVEHAGRHVVLKEPVAAKHKFARRDLEREEFVKMYGVVVGRIRQSVPAGSAITTANLEHAVGEQVRGEAEFKWTAPDVSRWRDVEFQGFHRHDGRVGTANHWIIVPLVFCQNRNLQMIGDALIDELGYGRSTRYRRQARQIVDSAQNGGSAEAIRSLTWTENELPEQQRLFPNVDGIKVLRHEGGCGGTYEDAVNLCRLFAGYINNPNVAGATILSLGCQKSEVSVLEQALHQLNPQLEKPVLIFEQQQVGSEQELLYQAMKHTVAGLMDANRAVRQPAPLSHLTVGVECGGSDGFSGISANPAIGRCSDLVVALGGTVILSEFPELAGCEADLMRRCTKPELADRFLELMNAYDRRAQLMGGGFHQNPSPGNIRDGLITDAMKSAGAARKGGTSPVCDVLDYPEVACRSGLNLLCTPGGDVESTTAMAGAGATVQIFSTGLGTPTGNPITPVVKVSTNTALATRMHDIIDFDAGTIITGSESLEQVGERLLTMVVETASGRYVTRAQGLGQDDFIPWKRGISF